MKLFINDKLIHLMPEDDARLTGYTPGLRIRSLRDVKQESLKGMVHLEQATEEDLARLLSLIEYRKVPGLDTLVCTGSDFTRLKRYVQSQFRIVKAAGGLVRKEDRLLLIYRLGKWDLPKGKLEKGERSRPAAVREVQEECGVEAELVHKLCTTWHTYMQEGKRILKKTKWYTMNCISDEFMEPQYVEGIEEIRWMTLQEAEKALEGSYRSIRDVIGTWKTISGRVGV